jgi:HSP20 family protein
VVIFTLISSRLGEKWHRVESQSGEFVRSFHLPKDIDAENITATLENGVLLVTIQKPAADLQKQANTNIAIMAKL